MTRDPMILPPLSSTTVYENRQMPNSVGLQLGISLSMTELIKLVPTTSNGSAFALALFLTRLSSWDVGFHGWAFGLDSRCGRVHPGQAAADTGLLR